MEEKIIDLNGHPTRLLTQGESGPLMVFLHGFPEYSGAWKPLFAQMEGVRCLALDQRGFGISYKPDAVEEYSTGKAVADLMALFDQLDEDEIHVLGHDWGAAVAYLLAFANDKRVKTLTIMNGVHPAAFQDELALGGTQAEASQYIHWLKAQGSELELAANNFEKLENFFSANMDTSWLKGETLAEYKTAWQNADTLRTMVNWYRASPVIVPKPGHTLEDSPFNEQMRTFMRVRVPHLLIWGMGDTALLPETRDRVKPFCDDLTLVEIQGADHWLHHQKPAEIARHLMSFVQAHST